jgi:hypothetical protein
LKIMFEKSLEIMNKTRLNKESRLLLCMEAFEHEMCISEHH